MAFQLSQAIAQHPDASVTSIFCRPVHIRAERNQQQHEWHASSIVLYLRRSTSTRAPHQRSSCPSVTGPAAASPSTFRGYQRQVADLNSHSSSTQPFRVTRACNNSIPFRTFLNTGARSEFTYHILWHSSPISHRMPAELLEDQGVLEVSCW